ncbi:MAG: redoxin domain-containing protein [Rikenellaceae bacterium]
MEREIIYNNKKYVLSGTKKRVGDVAENFTVTGLDMEPVIFYDLPKGVKIVSSCTSVNTPMCAMQNKRLNAEIYISTKDLTALAISVDLPFTQSRFSFEEDIEYITFLSDYRAIDFGMKYGVYIEELRLLSRALFVIDRENIIQYAEYITDNEKQFNYIKAISIVKALQKE